MARQEGTVTENTPGAARSTPNSRRSRMLADFAGATARPSLRCSQSSGSSMGGGAGIRAAGRPGRPRDGCRARFSRSSSMARARPRTVLAGSCDFSKRMEASVRSLMARRSLADRRRLEVGAFENDARGRFADGAFAAADHAGEGDGAAGIGDHQVRWVERVVFIVQRAEMLAVARAADEDGVAVQLRRSKACMGCASSAMM